MIIIKYDSIDLKKCTLCGLELMMEILLAQEWYEKCAEVRDELKRRKQNI